MAWVAPAIGAAAGVLGSRGGGSQTTTTTTTPWGPQQKYLTDLFSRSQGLLNTGQLAPVADFDPLELLGQSQMLGVASTQLPQLSNQALGAFSTLTNAPNVQSNPVLQQYIQAALRPLEQSLMQNVLPSIRGEAVATGNYGGSRQGIAEGLALQEFTQQGADVSTRIMQDAYARGLQAALGALGQIPNVTGAAVAPATVTGSVGGERRTLAQTQASQPQNALQAYLNLISGSYGGTTTAAVPRAQGNPLLGALGGALVGNNLQNLWQTPTATTAQPSTNINTWTPTPINWGTGTYFGS